MAEMPGHLIIQATNNSMYRIVKNISANTLYAATSTTHDLYQSTRLQDAILDASNALGKVIYSADNGATWQTLHDFGHPSSGCS